MFNFSPAVSGNTGSCFERAICIEWLQQAIGAQGALRIASGFLATIQLAMGHAAARQLFKKRCGARRAVVSTFAQPGAYRCANQYRQGSVHGLRRGGGIGLRSNEEARDDI